MVMGGPVVRLAGDGSRDFVDKDVPLRELVPGEPARQMIYQVRLVGLSGDRDDRHDLLTPYGAWASEHESIPDRRVAEEERRDLLSVHLFPAGVDGRRISA